MKRIRVLVCALLVMVLVFCSVGASASFDVAPYKDLNSTFSIDVDTDNEVAFIEVKLPTKERAFKHKYESDSRYSSFKTDILVKNYFSSNRDALLRTWITYCADTYQYIDSVSFIFEGKEYRFSDVADKEWFYQYDDGTRQDILIKYGTENQDFFSTVAAATVAYAYARYGSEGGSEDVTAPEMKMILHGIEDIEVDDLMGFIGDFAAQVIELIASENLSIIAGIGGTPCKVSTIE